MRKILFNLPALMIFCFALALFGIQNHSYGIDEAFSLYISRDWSMMIKTMWNEEANMWLYYLLLHFWQAISGTEFFIKILSVIFAVASLPLVYKTALYLFNKNVAKIACFLLTINLLFINRAQEARGYPLLLFLTTLSMYSFLRFKESNKFKVIYILSTLLAVYAHFYGGLILLVQAINILANKQLRKYFLSLILIALGCLPLILSPSFQSHQVDWMSRPGLVNLASTALVLTGDFPPMFVIYGLLLVSILPLVLKHFRKDKYMILMSWLCVPVITTFIFSLVFKPIYQSVYFIGVLPALVILAALALDKIPKRKLSWAIMVLILLFSLIRLGLWYSKNGDYKWVISNNSEDWRGLNNYVESKAKKGDAVVFYGYYNRMPYEIYLSHNLPKVVEISTGPYGMGAGTTLPEPNLQLIYKFNYPRVWLVLRDSDVQYFDRQWQEDEVFMALYKNYRQVGKIKFAEVQTVLFEKKDI